jgi:beta-xylosidase
VLFLSRRLLAGVAAATASILILTSPAASWDLLFSLAGQPNKIIDSAKQNFTYAYAPSIIYAEGLWYAYYCSTGAGQEDWDNIRYSTSSDGVRWSSPAKILRASDAVNERATCDPSVVLYDAGDGAYYYLFYTAIRPT